MSERGLLQRLHHWQKFLRALTESGGVVARDYAWPTEEPENLFATPEFAEAFAAFLRFNPTLWRIRRLDHFTPHDLDLAEHQVTIQANIPAALLQAFLARRGETLGVPSHEVRQGDTVTMLIPAMSAPKRLLLNFTARTQGDKALSMLSRYEGAQVIADDLLSRLIFYSTPAVDAEVARVLRGHEAGLHYLRLRTLIATLVFVNPHRLAARLVHWKPRLHRLGRNRGLPPDLLGRWVRQEGDEFAPHVYGCGQSFGDALADALETYIHEAGGPEHHAIPSSLRPDGLRYFPTLASLLIHGVQDLLKNVVQAEEPWPADHVGPFNARAQVMSAENIHGLIGELVETLSELTTLEKLMDNQRDDSANAELYYHLDRWTAFAVTDVQLGVPFVLKFSQTLPLTERRPRFRRGLLRWAYNRLRLWRTIHLYPLALQDALSVHVEVTVPDPELLECHL